MLHKEMANAQIVDVIARQGWGAMNRDDGGKRALTCGKVKSPGQCDVVILKGNGLGQWPRHFYDWDLHPSSASTQSNSE
jgi:hypothetical protein